MRAVEFSGHRRLAIVERPDPTPADGELLIAPQAVGICATDIEIFDGTMAYYRLGQARYPVIPGHEWSGEVVGMAEGVSGFRVGDHVVGEVSIGCGACETCKAGNYHLCADAQETGIMGRSGALATRMVHPASATFTISPELSWDAAALIEPTSVALNAAKRGSCRDKTVLVIGMGTIGQLALQCAIAEGARRTIAANPSPQRLELAKTVGADFVLPLQGSAKESVERLRRSFDGPIEAVLVCTGAPSAIAVAIEAADPGGTIVLAGLTGEATVPVDVDLVVLKDLALRGINGSPSLWPETVRLVEDGVVRTEPLVTHRLSLAEMARAIDLVRARSADTLKVMVHPQEGLP